MADTGEEFCLGIQLGPDLRCLALARDVDIDHCCAGHMPFLSDRGEVEQEVTTPRGHGYRDLADLSGQNHPVWLGDIGPAGVFFEYRASDEIPRLSPQPLKASSFVGLEDAVLIGYGERDRRAVEQGAKPPSAELQSALRHILGAGQGDIWRNHVGEMNGGPFE